MEQYLLFKAGGQTFGLPIKQTDKIISLDDVTVVPETSSYIVGMQTIEGTVIAVIDLAELFYKKQTKKTDDSEIIVVNWKETKVGLLVEEVSVVKAFDTSDLMDEEREITDGLPTSYITAFVQAEEDVIPLLDSHTLFTHEETEELRQVVEIDVLKD